MGLPFSSHIADAAQDALDECGKGKDTASGKFYLFMFLCVCKRG